MSYITEAQLSNYRSNRRFSKDNIVNIKESHLRDENKPMIFLSHKHDELDILHDVIAFLKDEGVDVYVDWMDSEMPAYTNAETAVKLKEKIKASNKFILVATTDAVNSKWCNWELGLGDAEKYIKDIALLPIDRTYESYKGAEYLKIYPYIEYENGQNTFINGAYITRGYYVKIPLKGGNRHLIPLGMWLEK